MGADLVELLKREPDAEQLDVLAGLDHPGVQSDIDALKRVPEALQGVVGCSSPSGFGSMKSLGK